jgi:hypothetical protein
MTKNERYERAYRLAMAYIEMEPELQPVSAIREAGMEYAIPTGSQLSAFVKWATERMTKATPTPIDHA